MRTLHMPFVKKRLDIAYLAAQKSVRNVYPLFYTYKNPLQFKYFNNYNLP